LSSRFVSVAGYMAMNRFTRLMGILVGAKPDAEGQSPQQVGELSRLEHCAYFFTHVRQSFVQNRCLIRASALSFSSLLALIPMLAVTISVTSSLLKNEGEEQIYGAINKFVDALVPSTPEGNSTVGGTNTPAAIVAPVLNINPTVTGVNRPGTNTTTVTDTNGVAGVNVDIGSSPAAVSALASTTIISPAGTAAPAGADDGRLVSAQKQAAKYIHDFVQNTRNGTLGVVGMLLLLYVAFSMLANIEATFNDIWGVKRGRNWLWRIVLYWAVLTLGPVALIGASSLGGGMHLNAAHQLISQTPFVGRLVFAVLPVLLLWLIFSLIYLTVPNTKVRFSAALVGGMVAGSLWQLNNFLGYLYVSRLTTNYNIYGSLFLVPVFMAGLYLSWVILLLGVQVSYAFQNRKFYLSDQFAENVNQRGREFIALRLMTCLGLRYQDGQAPATTRQIGAELGISTRLTQEIIQSLLTGRLVSELVGPEAAYAPARPLAAINAHQILLAMRSINQPVAFDRQEPVRDEIYGEFARIEEAERVAAAAVSVQALVGRARARLSAPPLALVAATPELTVTIDVSEALVEEPAEPPRRSRKIVEPEDHDFPL